MFTRLFGETEKIQFKNLKPKAILTILGLIVGLVGVLLTLIGIESLGETLLSISGIILFILLFIWGFGAIRALFGFSTIGAIFSGNVVFGVVIFVFCMMAAYFISIFIAFLGVSRFIYLKIKFSQNRR